MSKRNYNKISTEAAKATVEPEKVETEVTDEVTEPVIEEAPKVEVVYGIVDNCARLNVRTKPNIKSDVICVIPQGLKIVVCEQHSTQAFYEVHSVDNGDGAVGFHGFAMKKYITIKK